MMSISNEAARKSQVMAREALECSLDIAQVRGKFQPALAALAPPINNIIDLMVKHGGGIFDSHPGGCLAVTSRTRRCWRWPRR